jgi:hypothetical protein
MIGIDGLEMGCFHFDQTLRNDMGNREDRGGESTDEKRREKRKKERKI